MSSSSEYKDRLGMCIKFCSRGILNDDFFDQLIWSKYFCQIGPSQKRRTLTDLHELKDGVVLLDEEVRGVAPVVEHHVGLPVLGRDALEVDSTEIILALVSA